MFKEIFALSVTAVVTIGGSESNEQIDDADVSDEFSSARVLYFPREFPL